VRRRGRSPRARSSRQRQAARAVQAASATIPIVGIFGGIDPVKAGLVASLNRPGGNVTGVIPFLTKVGAKRLALLHDLLPRAATIAVLVNPAEESAEQQTGDVQDAARALGLQTKIVNANTEQLPRFAVGVDGPTTHNPRVEEVQTLVARPIDLPVRLADEHGLTLVDGNLRWTNLNLERHGVASWLFGLRRPAPLRGTDIVQVQSRSDEGEM
jgi:hypothetical protein